MENGVSRVLVLLFPALVFGSAGCSSTTTPSGDGGGSSTTTPSSSVDCSAQRCSADPAPTDGSKKACEDEKAGTCGSEYNSAGSCVNGKVTCGSDNKTDTASALKALADCATEIKAYQDCKVKSAGGDAGK